MDFKAVSSASYGTAVWARWPEDRQYANSARRTLARRTRAVSAAMVLGTLFSLAAVRLSAPARPAAPVLASRSSIKSAECDDLRDAASDCIDRDILANSSLALSCGTVADIGLDHYCDENLTFTEDERVAVNSLKASMSSCNLISQLVSTCWTGTSTSCNACECARVAETRDPLRVRPRIKSDSSPLRRGFSRAQTRQVFTPRPTPTSGALSTGVEVPSGGESPSVLAICPDARR